MPEYPVKLFKNTKESYRLFAVEYANDVICAKLVDDKPQAAWIEPKAEFNVMLLKGGWETDDNTFITFSGKRGIESKKS
jgi:hypothetical protein